MKEKSTLKEVILNRIKELEDEISRLNNLPDGLEGYVDSKTDEVNRLLKYNKYLYHWLEDPPTSELQ